MARLRRYELHSKLVELLGSDQVYFRDPGKVAMKYPAIVYSTSDIYLEHADDIVYRNTTRYDVTLIDKDPDSDLPDKMIESFEYCRFSRYFVADNLNHFLFNLYY